MSSFIEDRVVEFFADKEGYPDGTEDGTEEDDESETHRRSTPFKPSGLRKDELTSVTKPPIRGGGVHEL